MTALIYQPNQRWRFAAALAAAAVIHLAAISFGITHGKEAKNPGSTGGPPEIFVDLSDPIQDPEPEVSEPLATPPATDEFYFENTATPPPVRRQRTRATPLVRPRTN